MQIRQTEHAITVPAPADTVYRLIADAERWPAIFTPTVHVEYLPAEPGAEQRLRIWAFAGDAVRCWVSHRTLDPVARRVAFRQTSPARPVAAMRGEWHVLPSGERSEVVFRHWFSAENDDADVLDRIEEVVEHNSRAELDSLRDAANRAHLLVDWEDEVAVGSGQERVFRFLADAAQWPTLIPHVARVDLHEDDTGVQRLEMDTVPSTGGDVHTTVSVRVLLPPETIVYKQTTLPDFLTAHVGSWHVREDGSAVAKHTVVLKEEAITAILGPEGTVEQAAALVRRSIGGNSMATLRRARELAPTAP
ncbi:MAG TPA: SRPBCC family protein [Spirillospora sp.]|nr:SRPBCC family protein [Spirillospora sp.]